jgi:hypothetical protein
MPLSLAAAKYASKQDATTRVNGRPSLSGCSNILLNPVTLFQSGKNIVPGLSDAFSSRQHAHRKIRRYAAFKLLGEILGSEKRMARLEGAVSNELFDILAEWNHYLEHRKSDDFQVPPCP